MTRDQMILHLLESHDVTAVIVTRDSKALLSGRHDALHEAGTFVAGREHEAGEHMAVPRGFTTDLDAYRAQQAVLAARGRLSGAAHAAGVRVRYDDPWLSSSRADRASLPGAVRGVRVRDDDAPDPRMRRGEPGKGVRVRDIAGGE